VLGLLCMEVTIGRYKLYTYTNTLCRGLFNDGLSTV